MEWERRSSFLCLSNQHQQSAGTWVWELMKFRPRFVTRLSPMFSRYFLSLVPFVFWTSPIVFRINTFRISFTIFRISLVIFIPFIISEAVLKILKSWSTSHRFTFSNEDEQEVLKYVHEYKKLLNSYFVYKVTNLLAFALQKNFSS